MAEAARTAALLNGRPSAGFEDVRLVAAAVLNHRLLLGYKARMDKVDSLAVVKDILAEVKEIDTDLPSDVRLT